MTRMETEKPDALPCARDHVRIDPARPRCPHPTSACPFRENCPVIEAVRAREKGRPDPPPSFQPH